MTASAIAAPCTVAVSSAGECAPGNIATELLFSHRNDAQLAFTGIAKAVGKGEVQKSLGHALLELMSETLAQIGERQGRRPSAAKSGRSSANPMLSMDVV